MMRPPFNIRCFVNCLEEPFNYSERLEKVKDELREADLPISDGPTICHCPMQDTMDFDLSRSDLEKAMDFIEMCVDGSDASAKGCSASKVQGWCADSAVYVHCLAGKSRAPTAILAFLISRRGYSLAAAFHCIPSWCCVNPNFVRQLMDLESRVNHGQPSPFDFERYAINGLKNLFPSLSEGTIGETLRSVSMDIQRCRHLLMMQLMRAPEHRERILIEATLAAFDHSPLLSYEDVRNVLVECNWNRGDALAKLMALQEKKA
jgi:hypothetical protein